MPTKAITPEQLASTGSEDGEQLALFCWAALNFEKYPELRYMFHIPNGGWRHKAEAAKLRAMGVKSGVPDVCLPVRRGIYPALFVELKRGAKHGKREGKTSYQQDDWIGYLKSQGFGVAVAKGWKQARDIIIEYLEWKG